MSQDTGGVEETKRLLEEARAAGLKLKEIAKIIGVKPATVSGYGKPRKGGRPTHPMPIYHRLKIRAFLDNRSGTGGTTSLDLSYPSQRVARAHELIEELGRVTGAEDPVWEIVIQTIEAGLRVRVPKENPSKPTRFVEVVEAVAIGQTNPISERHDNPWPSTSDEIQRPKHGSINSTLPERRIRREAVAVERRRSSQKRTDG